MPALPFQTADVKLVLAPVGFAARCNCGLIVERTV
jgi:hypothetical protein